MRCLGLEPVGSVVLVAREDLDDLGGRLGLLQLVAEAVLANLSGELGEKAHVVGGEALVVGDAEEEEQVDRLVVVALPLDVVVGATDGDRDLLDDA